MKLNKRGLGQRKRKVKQDLAEGMFSLIWTILKWTILLPFTILYLIFKKIYYEKTNSTITVYSTCEFWANYK